MPQVFRDPGIRFGNMFEGDLLLYESLLPDRLRYDPFGTWRQQRLETLAGTIALPRPGAPDPSGHCQTPDEALFWPLPPHLWAIVAEFANRPDWCFGLALAASDRARSVDGMGLGTREHSCTICLDGENETPLTRLSCSHVYHLDCIWASYVSLDNQCPLCRRRFDYIGWHLCLAKRQRVVGFGWGWLW